MAKTVEGEGFLVVLQDNGRGVGQSVRTYQGVDRVPPYPSPFPEEEEAMDEFVFSDAKDPQSNLIPRFERALEIYRGLSIGRRRYEVILCCQGPDSPLAKGRYRVDPFGYDVAAIQADYWSIVDDFCASDWAREFQARLNEHGLFTNRQDAEVYLAEYQQRREVDDDSPFQVTFVCRVSPMADV
jgi:hypothetical protein